MEIDGVNMMSWSIAELVNWFFLCSPAGLFLPPGDPKMAAGPRPRCPILRNWASGIGPVRGGNFLPSLDTDEVKSGSKGERLGPQYRQTDEEHEKTVRNADPMAGYQVMSI